MTPIEFLSTFILRPITLTLRLLMNLVAGHLILAICFAGTHYLYFTLSGVVEALRGLSRSSVGSPSCASKSSLPDCRHTSSLC